MDTSRVDRVKAPQDTDSIRPTVVHGLRRERRPRIWLFKQGLLVVVNHSFGDIYNDLNTPLDLRVRDQSIRIDALALVHPQSRDLQPISHVGMMYRTKSLEDRRQVPHIKIVVEFHSTGKEARGHFSMNS